MGPADGPLGRRAACRRLAARVRGYFGKIIEERRVAGDCQERDDLLSYMLTLPEDERLEDSDVIAVLWVSELHIVFISCKCVCVAKSGMVGYTNFGGILLWIVHV